MFVVYNETGMILSTIIGPDESYGEILEREDKKWLFHQGNNSIDPQKNHVDIETNKVVPNEDIPISTDKLEIKADDVDASVISGIPSGSSVTIQCNGVFVLAEIVNTGYVELTTNSPGQYDVIVSCSNYNPSSVRIEAK